METGKQKGRVKMQISQVAFLYPLLMLPLCPPVCKMGISPLCALVSQPEKRDSQPFLSLRDAVRITW